MMSKSIKSNEQLNNKQESNSARRRLKKRPTCKMKLSKTCVVLSLAIVIVPQFLISVESTKQQHHNHHQYESFAKSPPSHHQQPLAWRENQSNDHKAHSAQTHEVRKFIGGKKGEFMANSVLNTTGSRKQELGETAAERLDKNHRQKAMINEEAAQKRSIKRGTRKRRRFVVASGGSEKVEQLMDVGANNRLMYHQQTSSKPEFEPTTTTSRSNNRLEEGEEDSRSETLVSLLMSSNDKLTPTGSGSRTKRRKRFEGSDRLEIIVDKQDDNNNNELRSRNSETFRKDTTSYNSNSNLNSNSDFEHESESNELMSTIDTKTLKCRVEKDLYLDFEEYKHYSCASCYNAMPKMLFWSKLLFKKRNRIWLFDETSGQNLLPNETEIIRTTFKAEFSYSKWRDCCAKAIDCCLQNSIYLPKTTDRNGQLIDDHERRGFCPATWDGLGCWQESQAGIVAQHLCPDNVYFLGFVPVCRGIVTKQCFSNGSWFIRNDHEWSDYNQCTPLPLYATRMLIGSVWHAISAIIIGPALIVLHKFPNRGGSKRVRILSNLLFWLLLNGLMAAAHKLGIIGGIFLPGSEYDDQPAPPTPVSSIIANLSRSTGSLSSPLNQGYQQQPALTASSPVSKRQTRSTSDNPTLLAPLRVWGEKLDKARLHYGKLDDDDTDCDDYANAAGDGNQVRVTNRVTANKPMEGRGGGGGVKFSGLKLNETKGLLESARVDYSGDINDLDNGADKIKAGEQNTFMDDKRDIRSLNSHKKPLNKSCSSALISELQQQQQYQRRTSAQYDKQELSNVNVEPTSCGSSRCKRSTYDPTRKQPAPVVFICWLFSLGIRITRLLGYSWMFTGAVYLCSILHFAPAEPPTSFIKWLMILTDGFPLSMGIVYLIARTIYESSPLTLIVKLPYYYVINDMDGIDELFETQLNCWMFRSKYDMIEEIADFPNLVLVILNGGLFVVTLIIMCRISRPGCTRNEMSLGDYFKAAGTLVVLYGVHYALFAYRPAVEGCFQGQFMYYAFLFVDGIQGIAVSYVFCYRTTEGKEIICKWLASCRNRGPKWCQLSDGLKHHKIREHGIINENNKSSTHSTRSNNSACNGKDVTTELIDIDENPIGSQF